MTPPIVSTEKKADREATQNIVSNAFEPQNGSNVQVPVSFGHNMNGQRRVSPRLKCMYESKQLHYGTSRRVSSQCPRDKKSRVTANDHFIQKTPIVSTEKNADKEATESITNNAFEPQNGSNVQVSMSFNRSMKNQICENISFESSLQRRVSPRLKCIYESKQLHYGTSRRVSSQCQRDKKSQVTANNHFIETIPIVSTKKKADREATQNMVSNSFEPQNGSNVHIPVSPYQSMNNQGSSVQRRLSPQLKNISESKRPYYGVSQTNKLQTSRDDENKKNVNSDHFIAKSSPIVSRKRDADKGFTSELYHLEPIDLPNGSSGNVKNQGSKSDLTVFVKASCSVSSANGSIDSKGVDPKWLDGCNIAPIADSKSPDTMVKETLRASYIHYRHVVQLTRSQMVSPRKQVGSSARPTACGTSSLGVEGSDQIGSVRATWTPSLTTFFLELVSKEIRKEGRPTAQLGSRSWVRIKEAILETKGIVLLVKQMKNKYQTLKKEWHAWQLLSDARRGVTGLGFDLDTGTFTAPDHCWAALIAQNEMIAKFKHKGLENRELMEKVFTDVTAGGRYAASAAYDPPQEETIQLDESSGDTADTELPERMTQRMGDMNTPSAGTKRGNRVSSGSASQKRKTSSSPTVDISATIQALVESRAGPTHTVHSFRNSLHHVGEAIRLMFEMPAFDDHTSPAYQWAVNFLGLSPMMLDIFVKLPSVESRLYWIEGQREMAAQTTDPGSAAHRAIPPSFLI